MKAIEMMSKEDTIDICIISTIEVLLTKLIQRNPNSGDLQTCHDYLMLAEGKYIGLIPEKFSVVADKFDDNINIALNMLMEEARNESQ